MTNPVGAQEQRERLRFRYYDTDGHRIAVVTPKQADRALDGLDIAETAMRAAAVLKELRKPRPRALLVRTWLYWQRAAIDVQIETLAEWDKWKGS